MNLVKTIGSALGSWLGVKSSPEAGAWLRGEDLDGGGEGAKLVNPYAQSGWVYVAVSTLAENVAQIPFRICRVTASARKELRGFTAARAAGAGYTMRQRSILNENEVESGPVVDLFERPHPSMDRALFWQSVISWQCLRGEYFIAPLDGQDQPVDLAIAGNRTNGAYRADRNDGPVKQMLTLSPDMLWHIVQGFSLEGWRYTGSPMMSPLPSQVLLPTELIHSKAFNPNLIWRGMSPIALALLPASSDYAAGQFMKGLMLNNADTGVIVTTDQQASPEQREAILSALRERKRKAGTPDRPLFLWGGSKLEKPTVSSADGQFLEHRNANRDEIFAILKVPTSMAGIQKSGGKSLGGGGEMEQDKLNFIEGRLTPLCRGLESSAAPIVRSFGEDLVGYFDVDDLPILQNARRARVDAGTKVFAMGVPLNSINRVYDLGFEEFPWGDEGYLPFSLQPASGAANPPEVTEPAGKPKPPGEPVTDAMAWLGRVEQQSNEGTKPEGELSQKNGVRKIGGHVCGAASAHYEAHIQPRIKRTASKLRRFWFEQKGRVLQALPAAMREFKRVQVEKDEEAEAEAERKFRWLWEPVSTTSRGIDEIFDAASENGKLLKVFRSLILGDLNDGGASLYKEIGLDNFTLSPKDAVEYLEKRKNVIEGINQTTWDKLKASLQEGLQEGDSMDHLVDRVKVFFNGQDSRSEMIATTEVNGATNGGRQYAMEAAGVQRKGWKTSNLEGTRDTHIENEQLSNEQNGIPIDEVWPNGCAYPGDASGEPGEVINCRCFGFAIVEREPTTD